MFGTVRVQAVEVGDPSRRDVRRLFKEGPHLAPAETIELPVVTLRLVHGVLEIAATRQAPDPGLLHLPAGEVELVGEDGKPVAFAEPAYLREPVSATHGGLLSVVVYVKLGIVGPLP